MSGARGTLPVAVLGKRRMKPKREACESRVWGQAGGCQPAQGVTHQRARPRRVSLHQPVRPSLLSVGRLARSYICNLIESVRDDNHMYIVMECLGGGELFEQLLAKGPFKEDYALAIFAQVAIACDYMHGLNVVHRDLKAENLVFAGMYILPPTPLPPYPPTPLPSRPRTSSSQPRARP